MTDHAANLLESARLSVIGGAQARIDFTYTNTLQRETARRYSDTSGSTLLSSTTFAYDAALRLENVQQRNGAGTLLTNATYGYDAASRLTSEVLNGNTVTYGYDATHQVTNGAGVTYSYDAAGNRIGNGQSIGAGNRLNSDMTWTYSYDDEGNLTRRSKGTNAETWDYTYDHRNQMVSATKKNTQAGAAVWTAVYTYDVFGDRVKQEIDADGAGAGTAVATKFAYDGAEVWADLDNANSLQTRYMKGDDIDELFARVSSGGTVAWYLTDRLGSVRNLLNNSGGLLGTIAYDAFGIITADTASGSGDRFKFTGREWDATLGLQFNRWRYYNPEIGRWMSEDPIRFGGGEHNLTRFVWNSPELLSDPDGRLGAPPGQGGDKKRDGIVKVEPRDDKQIIVVPDDPTTSGRRLVLRSERGGEFKNPIIYVRPGQQVPPGLGDPIIIPPLADGSEIIVRPPKKGGRGSAVFTPGYQGAPEEEVWPPKPPPAAAPVPPQKTPYEQWLERCKKLPPSMRQFPPGGPVW